MALSDGLVGLWSPFLGASGYRLLDRSGRGNHGTLTNMDAGTDWVGASIFGRSGYALRTDGTTQDINMSAWDFYPTLDFTVSLWMNPTSITSTYMTLVERNTGIHRQPSFFVSADGSISYSQIGLVADGLPRTLGLVTNANQLFTAIKRGTTVSYYLNGTFRSSSPNGFNSTGNEPNARWYLGRNASGGGTNFSGLFFEFATWQRALTDAEISQTYAIGPGWIAGRSKKVYGFIPAVSGVTGDLSVTLGAATLSSSGTIANGLTGSLTKTLDAATLSSSGTLTDGLTASLSSTLGNATLASDAMIADGLSGALSKTLDDALVSSDGTLTDGITATLSKTLDDATLSASGAESVGLSGSLSSTLDAATLSADGSLVNGLSGDLTATLGEASVSSSATLADGATGSVSSTLGDCTVSATASFGAGLTAELNAALDAATVSSSGTLASGLTADLSVQLASASLAASGVVGTPSTGSNFKINVGGVWKQATPFVNVGGVWKQATPFIKIDGEWK